METAGEAKWREGLGIEKSNPLSGDSKKLMEGPRATPDAEFGRSAEKDSLRQMRVGIKEGFPPHAQLVATRLRCIVAVGTRRGAE